MIQLGSYRTGRGRHRAACFGLALLVLASAAPALARTRAAGGERLIEALEVAPLGVVAEVAETRELGGTGYGAVLRVETLLQSQFAPGDSAFGGGPAPEAGAVVDIAWEELSPSRAPRFAAGERVLVALERLPGASIWLARIPDAQQRTRTLAVAAKGNAFLRSPSQASVLVLEHYLALPPELRASGNGVAYLAQLAARAEIPLAKDAVARLAANPKLAEFAIDDIADALVAALVRPAATPALQDALVDAIGERRPVGLRAPLSALTRADTPAPPVVYAALAALDDGLDAELSERLLALGSGPYREVVARYAGGDAAQRDLRALIATDPSADVRSRAIERLVDLRGDAAADDVAEALYDPEPRVRGTAAKQLGQLGDPAIPALQRAVESSDLDAGLAAVAGLAIIGSSESSAVLVEIATTHPDESMRQVATLAIGGKLDH